MAANLSDEDEISAINVTPLVDVMLVLLIIFMITAPTLYQNALKVQLPKAQSGEEMAKSTLQIGLEADGKIVVKGKTLTLLDLGVATRDGHYAAAIIMADRKSEHGKVIELIDTLKANGIQKFSFGVDKQ